MSGGNGQAESNGNGYAALASGPLTEQELTAIRRLLRDEDRAKFFWREVRRWGGYGAAVVTSVYVGWDTIVRVVGAIVQIFARGHQ
jgi:hypothetical protein